jgi:hypothetical protein
MNLPLALGCLWLIAANGIAMFPSRDHHWTNAYILIALGLPLVGWIGWTSGGLAAAAFLAGGASVLRWPVYFLGRWCRAVLSR